jgi:AcrR family transcriptional regulator
MCRTRVRLRVMRADAARNLEAVMRTGARLLAEDPATSMAAIAAEARVDRRTVYRHFPTREAHLAAVFQAKLDSAERVLDEARLTDGQACSVVSSRWRSSPAPTAAASAGYWPPSPRAPSSGASSATFSCLELLLATPREPVQRATTVASSARKLTSPGLDSRTWSRRPPAFVPVVTQRVTQRRALGLPRATRAPCRIRP